MTATVTATLTGLLTATRALLVERGLAQDDFIGPGGRLCLLGALRLAAGGDADGLHVDLPTDPAAGALVAEAVALLTFHLPAAGLCSGVRDDDRLIVWTDHPGRTLNQVLDLLDAAFADLTQTAGENA